jgi:hypothetical protein
MNNLNHADLPPGISILREWGGSILYVGSENAFLAAGIISPEWINGLGRFTRQIAINPSGGFVILGEGKVKRITYKHREHGAFTIKRNYDDIITVTRYRTIAEQRAFEKAQADKWESERRQEAWKKAKEERNRDFPEEWRHSLLCKLDIVLELITGERVFDGFPQIKVSQREQEAARTEVDKLKSIIQTMKPKKDYVEEREPESNVIMLRQRS